MLRPGAMTTVEIIALSIPFLGFRAKTVIIPYSPIYRYPFNSIFGIQEQEKEEVEAQTEAVELSIPFLGFVEWSLR